MKYNYLFSISPATHLLAKRKPNKQINETLEALFPAKKQLTCTPRQFEDYRDVMWAIGFVLTEVQQSK